VITDGRREHVLVRGAGPGQGRVRCADVDPQGQWQSDTFGQAPDQDEGVPAQTTGTPFYDGTEDAINFLLSTPQHPYEPAPSCTTGTSHAAKQNQRVAEGFDAAYNPFWQLLDPSEIGGPPATPTEPPACPTSVSGIRA